VTLSSENTHTRREIYKIWKRLGFLKTFDTLERTWFAKNARPSGIQSVD